MTADEFSALQYYIEGIQMNQFDKEILNVDRVICENIAQEAALGIKLLSQNIIAQLRNFVEAIALKIYSFTNETEVSYEEKKKALSYIRSRDDLSFLRKFHASLQVTASHSTMEPEAATRMMWKYLEFMYECKSYVKREFGLDILHNLDELEIINDNDLAEYYKKIALVLECTPTCHISKSPTDRFYINKKRPFRYGGRDVL